MVFKKIIQRCKGLIEKDAFWYKYGDSQEPPFLWKDISMNKMQ